MGKMKCGGCCGGENVSRSLKCFLIHHSLMVLCVFNNTENKLTLVCVTVY